MCIREYQESDWEAIVAIYDLAKKDEFTGIDFDLKIIPLKQDDEMLALFRESTIYVYDDECVKGFIGLKGDLISWLFVHPDHRRLKIASKLITHILKIAKGTVFLNVASVNQNAQNLYSKFGFVVTKEFEGKYQGACIKALRMELKTD